MRTVEDALQEIVTYVGAKFGLRIRDSKPSEKRTRGHSDPMDVDAANSLVIRQRERVFDSMRWLFQVGLSEF